MNPSNGLVSPQFHVKHDKFFKTINRKGGESTESWKILAGLNKGNKQQVRSKNDNDNKELERLHDNVNKSEENNDIFFNTGDDEVENELQQEESTPSTSISNHSSIRKCTHI